jgi:hypothetical protein
VHRVEGRGDATIHDVTISNLPTENITTSEAYQKLEDESKRVEDAIQRNSVAISSLTSYIQSMKMDNVDPVKLTEILDSFDKASENLDEKAVELNKRQEELRRLQSEEVSKIGVQMKKNKLKLKASVGVFAEHEGEVEIVLIYGTFCLQSYIVVLRRTLSFIAVYGASWHAAYDIRVNTRETEKPVTLIYKALIHQDTGEVMDPHLCAPTFDSPPL